MGRSVKGLAVLGSTGSIGTQTMDVVRSFPEDFRVVGLAAHRNLSLLETQVREFHPRLVACEGSQEEKRSILSTGCIDSSLEDMVRDLDVDLVVTATVGDVALTPTFAAIKAGKDVALANKESVVMMGESLTHLARHHNVRLLPIDSEPNAIWQCLRGEDRTISRLIITASGGAFRNKKHEQLTNVTPKQALNHPTWKMGAKITVDSATLMNKAFEVIEAHWLFNVPWKDIEVVVHPQSVVHSMVEFVDGSVKAHIGPPNMRLPIQYALFYPDRVSNCSIARFNPVETGTMTFERLNPERYPCFQLGLDIAMRGGSWPAALCGADDAAVEMFLSRRIGFLDIAPVIRESLEEHTPVTDPSPQDALSAAAEARKRVLEIVRA